MENMNQKEVDKLRGNYKLRKFLFFSMIILELFFYMQDITVKKIKKYLIIAVLLTLTYSSIVFMYSKDKNPYHNPECLINNPRIKLEIQKKEKKIKKNIMKKIANETYVLILSGISDETRIFEKLNEKKKIGEYNNLWNNQSGIYNNLLKKGLNPDNIYILYGKGIPNKDAKSNEKILSEFNGTYSNSAKEENLENILNLIKSRIQEDKYDNNKFILLLQSEGYTEDNESYFQLPDKDLSSKELLENIIDIKGDKYLFTTACQSGYFSTTFKNKDKITAVSSSDKKDTVGGTDFNPTRLISQTIDVRSTEAFKKSVTISNQDYIDFLEKEFVSNYGKYFISDADTKYKLSWEN